MKISFNKPANLNGATLIEELVAAGVKVETQNDKPKWVEVDADNVLWVHMDEKDKAKAEEVVAAHNG